MFGKVLGHRVDATDDGSEWDPFVVYLGVSINAEDGFPGAKAVI